MDYQFIKELLVISIVCFGACLILLIKLREWTNTKNPVDPVESIAKGSINSEGMASASTAAPASREMDDITPR